MEFLEEQEKINLGYLTPRIKVEGMFKFLRENIDPAICLRFDQIQKFREVLARETIAETSKEEYKRSLMIFIESNRDAFQRCPESCSDCTEKGKCDNEINLLDSK